MEETLESMMAYPSIYGKAINEIRQEAEEIGMEKAMKIGIEKGKEKAIEISIRNIRRKMGYSADQIADLFDCTVEFVESVFDKHE